MSTREEVNAKVTEYFGALDVASAAFEQQARAQEALDAAVVNKGTADGNASQAVDMVATTRDALKEAINSVT